MVAPGGTAWHMAAMTPPTLGPGDDRPGLLTRVWHAVSGTRAAADQAAPPLFRLRPLPPPEPRGPGLPPDDQILLEAPPPPDPAIMLRSDLIDMLLLRGPAWETPEPQAEDATGEISPPPALPEPQPEPPGAPAPLPLVLRPMHGAERRIALQVEALIESLRGQDARALLESTFADAPDAADASGLPAYLALAFRCAVAMNDLPAAADLAGQIRPLLQPGNPFLEVVIARNAVRNANNEVARSAWHAALQRAPGLPEALAWLALHPHAPDGGVPVETLVPGAAEAGPPARVPSDLLPVAAPQGAPGRWLRDVAIQMADASPVTNAGWDSARTLPESQPGGFAAVLRDPDDLGRATQFGETALALYALSRATGLPLQPARLYAGRSAWAVRPNSGPQVSLLAVMFPGLRVVADFAGAVRETAVLELNGAARDPATMTLLGCILPLAQQHAPALRARVHAACGVVTSPRAEGAPRRALYLPPNPASAVAPGVLARLGEMLQRHGFTVETASLSGLSWADQVRVAGQADLLFGPHTRALSAVLWAHPHARLLELFPPGVGRYENQICAEAAGIGYLGVEALEIGGRVTRGGERFGRPTQFAGGIITELPWALLDQALAPPP